MCAQPLEAVGPIWGPGPEPLSFLISPGAQEAHLSQHFVLLQLPTSLPPRPGRLLLLPAFPGDGPSLRALTWSHKPVVTGPEKSCSLTLLDRQTGTDGREEKGQGSFWVTGGFHWPHSLELLSSFV